jgi:hypothetical protein
MHVHVKIKSDPKIAGNPGRESRVVTGITQHAVDIVGLHAGILHRIRNRPSGERARRLFGATPVAGLTNSANRIFSTQKLCRTGVMVGNAGQ